MCSGAGGSGGAGSNEMLCDLMVFLSFSLAMRLTDKPKRLLSTLRADGPLAAGCSKPARKASSLQSLVLGLLLEGSYNVALPSLPWH